MSSFHYQQTRIIRFSLPKGYDVNKIQIGVPVVDDEAEKVGLKNVGDIILPSGKFGSVSCKNAYGYFYADYTQPKEKRCVSTNWIYPYGNDNASPIAVDIHRECYPKVYVPATEIEFLLYEDGSNKKFVVANLTDEIRKEYLKETINLFLEIFGHCYIFSDEIKITAENKRARCNWEILPPGVKPSTHLTSQLIKQQKRTDTFDVDRLKTIEEYKAEKIVEGLNGFKGYYAYIFEKYCVLESAMYGNATYFIPKENWEILSQKTKQELFREDKVLKKIIHNEKWKKTIREYIEHTKI